MKRGDKRVEKLVKGGGRREAAKGSTLKRKEEKDVE